MSVPGFQKTLLPILRFTSDEKPHRANDTLEYVLTQFVLTEEDLADRLPNGRLRILDRVLWAITYLRKAGLLVSVSWGVFQITDRGRALLAKNPAELGIRDLEQYPEFLEFKGRSRASARTPEAEAIATQGSPEEELVHRLKHTYDLLRAGLESELLDAFKTASPTFFEKAVVLLVVAMGYGGSIADAGQATKRSGDDGIDGVIKEDRLGLDVIHLQAKRWADKVVGRPEIQSFAGSLEGQRGRKGVFITTSQFSSDAREYVSRIEKKIVLIDGQELAKLCVDFGIGVKDVDTYLVRKLNPEFFAEE